jgi:hypothetical protein
VSLAIGVAVEDIPPPLNSVDTLICHGHDQIDEHVRLRLIDAAWQRLRETSTRQSTDPAADHELSLLEKLEREFGPEQFPEAEPGNVSQSAITPRSPTAPQML